MHKINRRVKSRGLGVALAGLAGFALAANAQEPAKGAENEAATLELPTVTVTGNPLGSELFDLATPFTVLEGEELQFQLQPTLGETLSQQPGINSTYYGPNASRPVIRGLDGERIRILQNGIINLDASGTSLDHAVSLDPLFVKRIEVIRGPAAIFYGTSAIGGVVNVIDDRIPIERHPLGLSGAAELRYGTNNDERSGAAHLDYGLANGLNFHVDGFRRETHDLEIPDFARSRRLRDLQPLEPGASEPRDRLPNSASESDGGAAGASYTWGKGYFGASYSAYNSDYGTVAEPDVTIDLEQRRFDIAGEVRELGPIISALKLKIGHSDYEHTEFEGAEVGTVFKTDGYDARIEAVHARFGPLQGAVGFQSTQFDFSALGEEAFLPPTHTRVNAGFIFEELVFEPVRFQLGARVDRQAVNADDADAFGPGSSRSGTTESGSLGVVYDLTEVWSIAASSAYTERFPNYQELYSNGRHIATGVFELGDPNLEIERSFAVDLGLRKKTGRVTGSVSVFYNRFHNFNALLPTGADDGDPDEPLPVFAYQGIPAKFRGFEAAAAIRIIERLTLELKGDLTRAENRDNGEPLPRISPLRYGGGLVYRANRFNVHVHALRVEEQNHNAPNELETDGYTLLEARVSYPVTIPFAKLELFARGVNLLDEEARNHVSFIKDIAPLGGRGVILGVRGNF